MTTKKPPDPDLLDRGLAAARDALAITPPAGHADQVAAAALRQPPAPAATWWSTAFPVVWRAAVVLDVAAIAILVALSMRAPAERARPAGDPIDAMLDDETSAVLTRALRLPSSDAEHGR